MELHVAQAVLKTMTVDAVILPCTSMGSITEPSRSMLLASGADAVELELKDKAPLAVGAAVLSAASEFTAQNTIIVPIKKHPEDAVAPENIKRAVKAALIAANIKRYETVALPNLVQLDSGTTRAEAARAVVQQIHAHTDAFPQSIYLVDEAEDMIRIFNEAIETAQYSL